MNKPGYYCPQCNSKYCELPVECKTCGITLVTSAHLVRPLHYLIPVHVFKDLTYSPNNAKQCYGCQIKISESIEQVKSSLTLCGAESSGFYYGKNCNERKFDTHISAKKKEKY